MIAGGLIVGGEGSRRQAWASRVTLVTRRAVGKPKRVRVRIEQTVARLSSADARARVAWVRAGRSQRQPFGARSSANGEPTHTHRHPHVSRALQSRWRLQGGRRLCMDASERVGACGCRRLLRGARQRPLHHGCCPGHKTATLARKRHPRPHTAAQGPTHPQIGQLGVEKSFQPWRGEFESDSCCGGGVCVGDGAIARDGLREAKGLEKIEVTGRLKGKRPLKIELLFRKGSRHQAAGVLYACCGRRLCVRKRELALLGSESF